MSRIRELTALHSSLRALIGSHRTSESDIQSWFEAHPAVFDVLGYQRAIPKPKLVLVDGQYYEPDFMVQDWVGVWFIFELKRPDTAVTKNPGRRTDFRAEFSSYVQQSREYANFFLDSAHRAQFENSYGRKVQNSVPSVIVAAVDSAVERSVAHELLFDRGNTVQLTTFSDVLAAIAREIERMTQDQSRLPGLYAAVLGVFPRATTLKSQFLFDFGSNPAKNRLMIGVSPTTFFAELWDDNGHRHFAEVSRSFVIDYSQSAELTLLEVEFGIGAAEFFLAIHVNRKCLFSKRTAKVYVRAEPLNHMVIGSDMFGSTPADFSAVEAVIYRRTLSWAERQQLYRRLDDVYAYYLSPLAIHLPLRITFAGHKWLHSPNHPVAPGVEISTREEPKFDPERPWAWYVASGGYKPSDGQVAEIDTRLSATQIRMPGM